MDGSAAIDRNLEALKRILAALITMAGLGDFSFLLGRGDAAGAKTLPRHLHRTVLRILRPAEAATRRLIIALAQSIVVKLPTPRPPRPKPVLLRNGVGTGIVMPRGQQVALLRTVYFFPQNGAAKSGPDADGKKVNCPRRLFTLPLLDPLRDPFRSPPRRPVQRGVPRISFFDGAGRTPVVQRHPPSQDDPVDAEPLARRLAGLALALDDLPQQVRRFARWQTLRDAGRVRRLSPLRPGRPPGGHLSRFDPTAKRGRNIREVDEVLAHAHALAVYALERRDTS